MAEWIDLIDPTEEQVREAFPHELEQSVLEALTTPTDPDGRTRPKLRGHGGYVFGVLLLCVLDAERDQLSYQEIDLLLSREKIVTVRKTPPDGRPLFDLRNVQEVCSSREHVPPGMVAYHLVDEVAEGYIDLADGIDDEIDELEEHIEDWSRDRLQGRISQIRHDLLHIRRTLAPTRDAVRGVVDGRIDIDAGLLRREVFPEEIERAFGRVLDKLTRATESLEFARDLLAGVRDYHATQIATDQNEVTKRLAAMASLLLFPTFIVGVYGQNFDHMPELHWRFGYAYSWGLIAVITLAQVVFFRKRNWL
jgi:magnesium transporter